MQLKARTHKKSQSERIAKYIKTKIEARIQKTNRSREVLKKIQHFRRNTKQILFYKLIITPKQLLDH